MAARMKDVASSVGVSVTTVSHVVNKTRYVAPQTRRCVLAAIRELDYHVDAHARSLARGTSDFLGLIVPDIGDPFFPEIINSFESAALERGFEPLLAGTGGEAPRTEAAVHRMIENKVRGVAIMTSGLAPALVDELIAHRTAIVFLDEGEVGPFKSRIRLDYSTGLAQAMEHLHQLGHTSLAFISGPQNLRDSAGRREAFIAAFKERGLSFELALERNGTMDGGDAARALLNHRPFPTAVFCSNDLTAIVLTSALYEAGLRVPENVSVIGFDDIALAQIANPPLTTVSLARERLGRLAVEALRNILRKRIGAEYTLPTQLQLRNSTGPPCHYALRYCAYSSTATSLPIGGNKWPALDDR